MGVNPANLEKLISLAETPVSGRWEALLDEVAALFLAADATCTSREIELYAEVLQTLLPRVDLTSRRHLAERLASSPRVPTSLLKMLAEDDERVAVPVCRRPLPLDDEILVGAVGRGETLRAVVAARTDLSPQVIDALLRSGDAQALQVLCENRAATLPPAAASAIARYARHRPKLQRALIARGDLPPALADEMVDWVEPEQRAALLDRGDLDEWSVEAVASGRGRLATPAPPIPLADGLAAPRRAVPPNRTREGLRRGQGERSPPRHLPISRYDQKVWTGPLFIGLAALLTIMVVIAGAIQA